MQLAHAARFAAEHQIAHGHAAGVKARDERRHGARRHESPGAIHVRDRLGHRLRHVRAGIELQLDEGVALNGLGLDVFDASDVEKVILVVIGEIALHLCRIHAAIRLGHVNRRRIEAGENIPSAVPDRQPRCDQYANDDDDNGHRTTQRQLHQIHFVVLIARWRSFLRNSLGNSGAANFNSSYRWAHQGVHDDTTGAGMKQWWTRTPSSAVRNGAPSVFMTMRTSSPPTDDPRVVISNAATLGHPCRLLVFDKPNTRRRHESAGTEKRSVGKCAAGINSCHEQWLRHSIRCRQTHLNARCAHPHRKS